MWLLKSHKGPSIKDVRNFFPIFDPYPPHVCNRLHLKDPSLKRTSANREFDPPPPLLTQLKKSLTINCGIGFFSIPYLFYEFLSCFVSANRLHYDNRQLVIDPCNRPSVQLCHVTKLNEGQFTGVNR